MIRPGWSIMDPEPPPWITDQYIMDQIELGYQAASAISTENNNLSIEQFVCWMEVGCY